jgi:uncharacterized protein YecT (DUF1311 family)
MRFKAVTLAALAWSIVIASPQAPNKSEDPCADANSNAEMRQCYTAAQARVNVQADLLVTQIAAELRKSAHDYNHGEVIAGLISKSTDALLRSQKAWKEYRDQYCSAVAFSYTTGSGAGTAEENCLFAMGRERVQMLRADFDGYIPEKADRHDKK